MKLQTRLERLKAQFEWGHIDEHEYRKKMDETRAQLALVPESDRIVAFDQVAAIVSSLPGAIDAASPARLTELIQMIVSRVTTSGRSVTQIEYVAAALPFFGPVPNDLLMAPPESLRGSGPHAGSPRLVRRGIVQRRRRAWSVCHRRNAEACLV